MDHSELRQAVQDLMGKWFRKSLGNSHNRDEVMIKLLYRECSNELLDVLQRFDNPREKA